jgi:hypothetical protein
MSQVPIELKWVQKVREGDGKAFEQLLCHHRFHL